MTTEAPIAIGEPVLRWSARAHSIAEIEAELARIWAGQDLTTEVAGVEGAVGRHVSARTSVMNLVVIARRPELAQRGPASGVIDAGMMDVITEPAERAELEKMHALERMGLAEEVAEAAVWLTSDASAFTTGTVLAVDGGFLARP